MFCSTKIQSFQLFISLVFIISDLLLVKLLMNLLNSYHSLHPLYHLHICKVLSYIIILALISDRDQQYLSVGLHAVHVEPYRISWRNIYSIQ